MKIAIDISKDRYDEIMSMDWKNCRLIFDEDLRAIHDGKALEQEPCVDAISRQAVQTELENCEVVDMRDENDDLVGYYNADTVDSIVRNLPPVTPAEKVGQWISNAEDDLKISEYTCSNCKGLSDEDSDYCPKCGSKMMQEVEECQ